MNWVFRLGVESNAMGIGRVSFSSKYAYSGVTKGGFNSGRGGDSKEGAIGVGIDSYFLVYGRVVLE